MSPALVKRIGAFGGLAVFVLSFVIDPPFAGMSDAAWETLGFAVLLASWWITEWVPIPVTSFLPLVIAPVVGLGELKPVAASYAHPLIFLFLGGFVLSLGIEKVNLHKRIASTVVAAAGTNPKKQVGAIMLVTAGLSMWISNTATAVIMLPIALSVAKASGLGRRYVVSLLLAVAYSASIGGLATLVGTPPNALLAGYLEDSYGVTIGFSQWMMLGVPLTVTLLVVTWWMMTRGMPQSTAGEGAVEVDLQEHGAISRGERRVAIVFAITALAWIFRSLIVSASGIDLSDTGIAMACAVALFVIPSGERDGNGILVWKDMERLPWGVLLLFGGGLALAYLMKHSGLADYIGESFSAMSGVSTWMLVAVVVGAIVFLTEVTSNTATAASLLPLVGPIAVGLGESATLLAIPAAIAASCAFMLPVATPPNAIIFSSGEVRVSDMVRAGLWLNLVSIFLLTLLAQWLVPVLFG